MQNEVKEFSEVILELRTKACEGAASGVEVELP